MKATRYYVHPGVLDAVIRPYASRMIEKGGSRLWSETALVYVSNMFIQDSFQRRPINAGLLKKNLNVQPKILVEAGVLERDGNYKRGGHCFRYTLIREYQTKFKEAYLNAVEAAESRFDVRYGPDVDPPVEALEEEEEIGLDDILNQIDFSADVPLIDCLKFMKNPTVMMYLEQYISKLKQIEMHVVEEEVHAGISYGVDLVRSSPEESPEAARGWSYIYTGQAILDRTTDGVFRSKYVIREFRFFETAFQQYPSAFNKADLIDDRDIINIDQVTSHATISLQMMDRLGLPAEPIREYVTDREGVIEKLGLEKDALKVAFNAFLNGAKVGPNTFFNKRTGAPLSCFKPFLDTYGEDIGYGGVDMEFAIKKYQAFVRWLKPAKKSVRELSRQAEMVLKSTRREGTLLGHLAQVVELGHKVCYTMTNKVNLVADAHDGLVLDTMGNWSRSTVEADRLTGYVLEYVEKDLGGSRRDQLSIHSSCKTELPPGASQEESPRATVPYDSWEMSHLITRAPKGHRSWTSTMKNSSCGETVKPERASKRRTPRPTCAILPGFRQDAPWIRGWRKGERTESLEGLLDAKGSKSSIESKPLNSISTTSSYGKRNDREGSGAEVAPKDRHRC